MNFNPGDLVKLKSGGNLMTVAEVAGKGLEAEVFCIWNETVKGQSQIKRDAFPAIALEAGEKPTGGIKVGRITR